MKIICLIHCQMRVNHFKFSTLSAIEWRINEMMGPDKTTQEVVDIKESTAKGGLTVTIGPSFPSAAASRDGPYSRKMASGAVFLLNLAGTYADKTAMTYRFLR